MHHITIEHTQYPTTKTTNSTSGTNERGFLDHARTSAHVSRRACAHKLVYLCNALVHSMMVVLRAHAKITMYVYLQILCVHSPTQRDTYPHAQNATPNRNKYPPTKQHNSPTQNTTTPPPTPSFPQPVSQSGMQTQTWHSFHVTVAVMRAGIYAFNPLCNACERRSAPSGAVPRARASKQTKQKRRGKKESSKRTNHVTIRINLRFDTIIL